MNIQFGLVIQGPVTTFGSGPNHSQAGFVTDKVILENIQTFSPHVKNIVISTWEDCGIDTKQFPTEVKIIENKPVIGFDFLNQRKQFITTQTGVEWLRKNTSCTHVLKIRTDQLIPLELISWLQNFYENSQYLKLKDQQENFIIFSEGLRSESFYAGDFIFAGTISDLSQFCEAVLSCNYLVHPMNASDYVLKWLQSLDSKYFFQSKPLFRSFLTARNSIAVQSMWNEVLKHRISFIPKGIYKKIQWRGKYMSNILVSLDTSFFFNEDIPSIGVSSSEVRSPRKAYKLMREYWKRYLNAKRNFMRNEG